MSKKKLLRLIMAKKPKAPSDSSLQIAIARIRQMECYMDEVVEYLTARQNTVDGAQFSHPEAAIDSQSTTQASCDEGDSHAVLPEVPAHIRSKMQALSAYMNSGQWLEDYKLDESGALPSDLKRGVLSEDGLYNLLQEAEEFL